MGKKTHFSVPWFFHLRDKASTSAYIIGCCGDHMKHLEQCLTQNECSQKVHCSNSLSPLLSLLIFQPMQKCHSWRIIQTSEAKPELYLSTTEKQLPLLRIAFSLANHSLFWAVWDLSYRFKTGWTGASGGIHPLLHYPYLNILFINSWWGPSPVYRVLYGKGEGSNREGHLGQETVTATK